MTIKPYLSYMWYRCFIMVNQFVIMSVKFRREDFNLSTWNKCKFETSLCSWALFLIFKSRSGLIPIGTEKCSVTEYHILCQLEMLDDANRGTNIRCQSRETIYSFVSEIYGKFPLHLFHNRNIIMWRSFYPYYLAWQLYVHVFTKIGQI